MTVVHVPPVRRFVPIAPAPPNGIKSLPIIENDDHIPDPRYQGQTSLRHPLIGLSSFPVGRLLNPCRCQSIWECQCNRSSQGRLETLVQVAASIASNLPVSTSQQPDAPPTPREAPPVRKSCCALKSAPRPVDDGESTGPFRGPDLPPLLFDPENMVSPPHDALPFATPTSIPSIKSVVLLAGTGCSCGFECACPGCVEHRVSPSQESSNLRSCSDDCPHCVDRLGGIALPEPESASRPPSIGSAIEAFLSRAANLPPPPKNRSAGIDPTNITVFPPGLFSLDFDGPIDSGRQEKARSVWGLVEIPKLECCAGACGCPDGRCGCGNSCAGCCVEGDAPPDSSNGSSALAEPISCCTNT